MRSPLIINCSFWNVFRIWWKIILNWSGSFGTEQILWFDIWGNVPLNQHIKHSPNLPFSSSLTSDALTKVSYLNSEKNISWVCTIPKKRPPQYNSKKNMWSVALITLVIKQHKATNKHWCTSKRGLTLNLLPTWWHDDEYIFFYSILDYWQICKTAVDPRPWLQQALKNMNTNISALA